MKKITVLALSLGFMMSLMTSACRAQTAEDYSKKGNELEKQGNYEEAINEYTNAIDADYAGTKESTAKYYSYRAHASLMNEDSQGAIKDYTEAIKIFPNFAEGYYFRGQAYYQMSMDAKAIADYTKAIELDPKKADYYYSRGSQYYLLKKYSEALQDMSKALELDPTNKDAQITKAECYVYLKDADKAWAQYDDLKTKEAKFDDMMKRRMDILLEVLHKETGRDK